jgi:uncharacterized membrane protein
MRRWLQNHRIAFGYAAVGIIFTGLFLVGLDRVPIVLEWLGEKGYKVKAPEWLLLLLSLPVFWWIRLHSLTDLPIGQQILSVLLRNAILIALALALMQITHVREESELVATVFVVDVSDSVPDVMLEKARDELQKLWDSRGTSRVRLVTFAEEAKEVTVRAEADGRLPPIQRHANRRLGTDLQQAMRLAYGLYPPGHLKRMVLVTDGNETSGYALSEVVTAAKLGIRIHHVSAPKFEPPKEIMVTAIDVPESIEQNIPFEVSATVRATYEGPVTCHLGIDDTFDNTSARVKELRAVRGHETVGFDEIRLKKGGTHRFEVRCWPGAAAPKAAEEHNSLAAAADEGTANAAPKSAVADNMPPKTSGDTVATNNHFSVTRFVPEKKRVLYIEGESLYSKNFRDALADEYDVEIRGARGIPRTLADAQKFSAIVISDVPREGNYSRINMTTRQMKLLDSYAKRGGLLLFTGGQDSLGPGGYGDTYLERQVLPVRLDVEHELETPRVAMVLVIDKSASMNGGKKIELAKKAARETVRVLDKRDLLAIVGFDSEPQDIIRLTRASNKTRFDRSIRRLRGSGGTNIYLALERGFEILAGVDAKIKHVILMTDGQSDKQGILVPVQRAVRKGVTVSAVALGRQADRNLLYQIANAGKGRFYFTENAEAIPKLFVDETREVAGESVKAEVSRPKLRRKYASLRFLKGINARNAPPLSGWVPTQQKRKSEVIMTIGEDDPLLARWKRGKGWVYVFTSDIKNKWASRWLRWPSFAAFWRQLIKDGIQKEEKTTIYPMTVTVARHELHMTVDAVSDEDEFIRGLDSTAAVTAPNGSKQNVPLHQTAPGRYEARIEARQYGPYQVAIQHSLNGKPVAISQGQGTYAYAEELITTSPDLSRIVALSTNTGGLADPSPEDILKTYGQSVRHEAPIWHYFLYAVLGMFIADVLLRRFRFWPTRTVSIRP